MPWKIPLLPNNLLYRFSQETTSSAPASSAEDAFHACWGECYMQDAPWLVPAKADAAEASTLSPSPAGAPGSAAWCRSLRDVCLCTGNVAAPHCSMGSTDPCSAPTLASPLAARKVRLPCQPDLGRMVRARMQHGEMLHLWSPASLDRGWGGCCGSSKTLAFLDSPRVAGFPWRQSNRTSVGPSAPSHFLLAVHAPLFCYPSTEQRGESCLHPYVFTTSHLCASTQQYHKKPLFKETKLKSQYEKYLFWKIKRKFQTKQN